MGARSRPAGLEQGKNTRVRFFFFKREELENFQRSRLSPVKTSSYFFSSSSSPFFWIFDQLRRGAHFFSPIPNQLMRGSCFWMCFSFQHGNCCFTCEFPGKNSSSTTLHLSRRRALITAAPCLISDTANVTSNHQTLCAGGTITGAMLAVTNFASRSAGRRGRESDYVIDIYLDRMKVL